MKKLLSLSVMALLVLSILPMALAVSIGTGVGVSIETEDFAPLVWMCDNRVVYDDATEPGRISEDGQELIERINNYAFEGEQITWDVLVLDKNGINKVKDVFVTVGDSQGEGNDIEANCVLKTLGPQSGVPSSCNAYIGEEKVDEKNFDNWNQIAAMYKCTFTVETPESMYGEYFVTVEAVDLDDLSGVMAENEYWHLNPVIALSVDGDLAFENVRPGTFSYSDTLLLGNDADDSSGVMLDMFISGSDFYDSSSSGAMCPNTNQLSLSAFDYYVTNGAYSSIADARSDVEGYNPIEYGIGFNNPNPFYDNNEILQARKVGPYYTANLLAPGAEMALTFRLNLPEPCNGDFDSGSIYFWGEAI